MFVCAAMMFTKENSLEEKVFNLALEDYQKASIADPRMNSIRIETIKSIINKDNMFELSHQRQFTTSFFDL